MIYTTEEILKIKSSLYCCLGKKGDELRTKLRGSLDHQCLWNKIRIVSLFLVALDSWKQSSDGKTIDEDNVLTVAQRDAIIRKSIDLCGCVPENQTIITISNDYWKNGYTDEDDGDESYNG